MTADTPSVGHDRSSFWFGPWIQAARPIAFPMILVPLLIGQAMAFRYGNTFGWVLLGYSIAFGALFQLYLLYTNDHADEAIDKTNHQHWLSGGSRVLPEGKLTGDQLLAGSRVALVVLVVLVGSLAVFADRPLMLVASVLAVALCWAYNRPPMQWSYRGRGDVLQGMGCGVLLPLIGYYLQVGTVFGFPWPTLVPLFLIFYAGNMVTALPDFASDVNGGKRTFPVRHGQARARWTILGTLAVAFASLPVVSSVLPAWILAGIAGPSVAILVGVVVSGLVKRADVAEFPQCLAFVNWISVSQAWFLCAWISALFWESTL